MKFVKQAFKHKPEDGVFGDCHRTCISILLNIDRDSVPNFGEHYGDGIAFNKSVQAYLKPLGLIEYGIPFSGKLDDILKLMGNINPDVFFILGGWSRNECNHSVIANHTGILWDPSQNDSGIIAPCDDGYYWIYTYVKAIEHA